jgi:hypothetical protein
MINDRVDSRNPVCVLLSCDQESKQRSPAQSPRWLVPWTAVRSSRARALRCEQSPHPPISSAGKTVPPARADVCLSRGPDQHPLGGDTAALPVAAPAQKHTGAGSSPGLYRVGKRSKDSSHETILVTSNPLKTAKSQIRRSRWCPRNRLRVRVCPGRFGSQGLRSSGVFRLHPGRLLSDSLP